uniref:Uncharacterized protein LOC114325740 n=1 Tax=Diabrotica virgifera virgifera TaxID=50390 RepID=A0A6P7F7L0_DIAVI
MVKYLVIGIFISFSFILNKYVYCANIPICLNPKEQGTLVADLQIEKNMFDSIYVRLPESGFLDAAISCIKIYDIGNSFAVPVINDGGLGFPYVEISIEHRIPKELKYRIQVFKEYH